MIVAVNIIVIPQNADVIRKRRGPIHIAPTASRCAFRRSACRCFPNGGGPAFFCRRQSEFQFAGGAANFRERSMVGFGALGKLLLRAAILLLPVVLAACAGGDEVRSITYTDDRGVSNQPFPNNYRAEILAFMKTYLNNPAGVRDAAMADPVQRTVGGRLRYVSCLRFASRESDGSWREPRERAVLFVDGRLDRVIENPSDPCAGAAYAPFPELEKMSR